MTENQQKALENLKRFVENDLNGNLDKENFKLQPGFADDNTVILSQEDSTNSIIVKYNEGRTEITFKLEDEWLDKRIEEFKNYIDTVDDDIFVEACEAFEKDYGKGSLEELNECVANKRHYRTMFLMRGFLNHISKIAREKIESMIFKYFPEYKEFINNNSFYKVNNPKDINELD